MHNLVHTNRYSGKLLIKNESVSDHVWSLCAYALIIVPKLNIQKDVTAQYRFNLKEIIYRCVVHDLDESVSLDIPRPFKYHNKSILTAIEQTNEDLIREVYESNIVDDILNAKTLDSAEGILVKIFDSLQTAHKMKTEVMLGNKLIKSELPNVIGVMSDFMSFLTETDKFSLTQQQALIKLCEDCKLDMEGLMNG